MPYIFKEILHKHGFDVELTDQNFAPHELPEIIEKLGELQRKCAIKSIEFSNSLRKLKALDLYTLFSAIPRTVTSLGLSNNNLSIHSHSLGDALCALWTRDSSEEEGSGTGTPTIKLIDLSQNTLNRLGKDAFIYLIKQLPPSLLHIFLRNNKLSTYSGNTLKKALRQLTPDLIRIYLEGNNIDFGTQGGASLLTILSSRSCIQEMQLCGNNFASLADKELWSLILKLQSNRIIFSNASEEQLEGTVIIRTDDPRMKQALPAATKYSLTAEYIQKMAKEKQILEAEMQQGQIRLSTERRLELKNAVLAVAKEKASSARAHSSLTSIEPTASPHTLTQKPLSTTLAPPKKQEEKHRLKIPQKETESPQELHPGLELEFEFDLELEQSIEEEIQASLCQPVIEEPTASLSTFLEEWAKKQKEEKTSDPPAAKAKHTQVSSASFWKKDREMQQGGIIAHKQSSPGWISELTASAASASKALSTATTEGLDISYRTRSDSPH